MRGSIGIEEVAKLFLVLFVMIVVFLIATQAFGHIPSTPGGINPDDGLNSGPVTPFDSTIQQASFKYGVEMILIKAVIKRESDFDPSKTSGAGAMGLMQLMPDLISDLRNTQTKVGQHCRLTVSDSFDPAQNINGGTCYLSYLLKKYNYNKELALAAYNAGPGRVDSCNCIPDIEETQNYVRAVLNDYNDYKGRTGWTSTG